MRRIVFDATGRERLLAQIARAVVQSGRNATIAEAVDSKTLLAGRRFVTFATGAVIRSVRSATDRDGWIAELAEGPASDNSPSFSSQAK